MKCKRCKNKITGEEFNYLAITRLPLDERKNSRKSSICTDLCNDCIEELKIWLGDDGYYM